VIQISNVAAVARDPNCFQKQMGKGYYIFLVLSQELTQEEVLISHRTGLSPPAGFHLLTLIRDLERKASTRRDHDQFPSGSAQVAMISPWIRKIKDTLTRTCWRLRCCITRIPYDPGPDFLSCAVSLIGDSGHHSEEGCRIGFPLLMQSFRPYQTVQS
jgi:hypothetical protein